MSDQYVVGVASVLIKDTTNDIVVLKGKTLLNSALSQSIQNTEITGGPGNKLLYDWAYGKKLEVKIEDAAWDEMYLALNNGVSIVNGSKNIYIYDESVVLTAGVGSVVQTPVGNVYVEKTDGTFVTVTPSTKSITVAGGAATTVKCTYRYATTVDSITVDADTFPTAYELTLFSEIVNGAGKVADLQIVIPSFKISGSAEINFGATSASTSKLDGKALADSSGNYAYIYIDPVSATIDYAQIAVTPGSVALTTGETQQLSIIGIRGGNYANVTILPADCSFVSGTTATCTVNAGGLITFAGAGVSTVTVTHTASSLTDVCAVSCS